MRKLIPLIAACALFVSACATTQAAQAPEPEGDAAATAPATAPADTATAPGTPAAALVPPGEAKIGDRTTCPVSGDEFVVTADSPKAEYQGKTYYFCCEHCPADFQANPAKFVHAG